jgi:MoaA/NifB/PqqE/SkfB family radical SAM enzyme
MRRSEGLRRLLRLLEVVLRNLRGYERSTPRPYFMVVEPTNRCNARCTYCDSWRTPASERERELTAAEHVDLLRQARSLGVRMVSYTGGEPLLRPDLVEIALAAKRLGLRTLVNTNAYGIGERNAGELLSAFDAITVSVDSLDREVQAERRGQARSLDLALRGIEALLRVRRHPAQVRVNVVVDEENLDGVGSLARHFREKKVPVLLQPRHRSGLFPKVVPSDSVRRLRGAEPVPDAESFSEAFAGLTKAEARYVKPFYEGIADHLRGEPRWFRCYAGSYSFQVGPRGDVMVCQTLRKSEGNVREAPLRVIWERMLETRRHVSSDERGCSCWLLCTTLNYLHADRADRFLRRVGIDWILGRSRGARAALDRRGAQLPDPVKIGDR